MAYRYVPRCLASCIRAFARASIRASRLLSFFQSKYADHCTNSE